VIGINDQIVSIERSQTLVDICRNARVEKHEGGQDLISVHHPTDAIIGHFIPSKSSWRQFFAQFIRLDDYVNSTAISSPNLLLTGSGATTPTPLSRPASP
jgi:hypothetical protein